MFETFPPAASTTFLTFSSVVLVWSLMSKAPCAGPCPEINIIFPALIPGLYGPATGVPTYTEQADLNFALSAGHGDFLRIVSSPATVEEAYYLTAEMMDLVWKFQTPGILLTEKHLSESSMTVDLELDRARWAEPKLHNKGSYKRYLDTEDGVSPMAFPPSKEI